MSSSKNKNEPNFTEEQIRLKKRLEEYRSNPQNTVSLKQFLAELKSKYGL